VRRKKGDFLERIVVSSSPPGGLDSLVDYRFARCSHFTVVDVENGKIINVSVVPNQSAMTPHGAGIQAAQVVASLGAQVVITGNVGPNAFSSLQSLGIKIYVGAGGISVKDAIMRYLSGSLSPASGPGSPGRGMGRRMGRGMGTGRGRRW